MTCVETEFASVETVLVEAVDGFQLTIEHFSSRTDRPPVVLCPGFGGNRFNFDLDENHSLARYLDKEGFDIWTVELRGHGRSQFKADSLIRGHVPDWNMDDHIEKDVPAILDAITKLTAHRKLIWIGHSLGGMVVYCLLARYPEFARFFVGLITIGSPGHVERKGGKLIAAAMLSLLSLKRQGGLPTRPLMRILFSPAAQRIGLKRLWRLWLNPDNMDRAVLQSTMRLGTENFSPGILRQWLASMRMRSLISSDGSFDYFQKMNKVDIPVLFIGGTVDRLAPVSSINAVYDRVQSLDKRMRIFGKRGFELMAGSSPKQRSDKVDYGHDDLLLGEASYSEVFPYIARWIEEHQEMGLRGGEGYEF